MKQSLTILVSDQNQYFSEGLRQSLLAYFNSKSMKVNITENLLYKHTADVVFLSAGTADGTLSHELCQRFFSPVQCVFIIEESNQLPASGDIRLSDGIRSISRKQNIGSILVLLEEMLAAVEQAITQPPLPADWRLNHNTLSAREYEVMRYMSLGINPGAIGRYLQISEKTVSAHKRTVMRKLNLIKNIELNYWLINGGLNFVRVYRQPNAI